MSFLVNPYWYASAGCADADAVAFLSAAGITDPTITSAICTLVTSMKADGTWSKCNAIYPFVGNTASQQKWNLKDPRDLNAAYRLQFFGGVTFSANGITGNGTNGYCDTFIANTTPAVNSNHIATYSRTAANESSVDIGTYGQTSGNTWGIHHSSRGFGLGMFFRNQNLAYASAANADGRGFYLSTRTAALTAAMYKNGINTCNLNVSTVAMLNETFQILAINNSFHSARNLAFASVGSGFNASEALSYYNSVQTFQTSLSRQV